MMTTPTDNVYRVDNWQTELIHQSIPDDASQAGAAVTGDAMLHWLRVVSPQIEWIPTSCITHSSLPLNRESFWVLDKLCAMSQAVSAHMWVL